MVSTDPIADMLTRIRNALAVRQTSVSLPYSTIKESVAKILADTKYIESVAVDGEGVTKKLVLTIATEDGGSPVNEINRISKPGRRVYTKVRDIPVVKQGRGLVIISTSQGIMTGNDAKAKKIGGEVICEVY